MRAAWEHRSVQSVAVLGTVAVGFAAAGTSTGALVRGDRAEYGHTLHGAPFPGRPRQFGVPEENCFEDTRRDETRAGDGRIEQLPRNTGPYRYSSEECKRHERQQAVATMVVHAGRCVSGMAHEFPGSDWGDWLPREIARANPDGVDIWYLGCNGFTLKASDGTTLFVDPYCGAGDPPRPIRMLPVPFDPADVQACDALLATHEHSDHVHGPTQAPILANTGSDYYAPDDSLAVVDREGWTDDYDINDQFVEVAEGEEFTVGSFTVHVESADDPDATHPVSYVIDHEAGTFFHGGDARPGDAFKRVGARYDIDLGVLAFGSSGYLYDEGTDEYVYTQWYSGETEIVEAAAQVGMDRLLPAHWDIWKNLTADPSALRPHVRSLDSPRTLEIVEIGDRVSV
jgi:L-ascorbate 6-phosphate lactonase